MRYTPSSGMHSTTLPPIWPRSRLNASASVPGARERRISSFAKRGESGDGPRAGINRESGAASGRAFSGWPRVNTWISAILLIGPIGVLTTSHSST